MSSLHQHRRIPGTPIFDGVAAQRGYALNHADNRASLLRDADRYCCRFGLSDAQIDAVNRKHVLALLACP